ncbi:hypothetical protein C5C28_14840 [Rathayibacter rathayi]|nr:hypothetical protein C5C28_14840 [Rathayibacter rathayi]
MCRFACWSLSGTSAAFLRSAISARFIEQLNLLGDLSRHLRPMSRSFTATLRPVNGVQTSARAWRDALVQPAR